MTQDFIYDFIESCKKQGLIYFISVSPDNGDSVQFFHNYNTLPKFRNYPDGARRTQKEDFQQFISTIDFTDESP